VAVGCDSPRARAEAIWPKDEHPQPDAAAVRYLREHPSPGQKVLVLWAGANVSSLADRPPVIPYMWRRNIETIPGVRERLDRELQGRSPALVALVQRLDSLAGSGRTAALLQRDYPRVAVVDGVPIYAPRQPS